MAAPPAVTGYTGLTQQVRLCLEANAGEQLLMPQTAAASTMSLTTQPNAAGMATTGAQLHFYFVGNTGSGTVNITGTAPVAAGGGAVVSQTYHIPASNINNPGYTEFTTTEVFASVTAASITLSAGLIPSTVMVFGSPAGKYLIPITADAEEKIAKYSPPDKRGILFKNLRVMQLTKTVSLDKFDCALYPDSLWALYMLVTNNPTITTVPASPTVLLAATTKAATMTLTTSPAAPGQFFIFTPASNSVAGTIGLTGKDIYGNNQSETVNVGANNNVVYSAKRYSSINVSGSDKQFTTTGLSAAATIAVSGAYAWTYTGLWDGANNTGIASACLEIFDGVMGVKLPYTILTDGVFDWQKEKEIMLSCKGEAQDYLVVGDPGPASYPSGTNPFATLSQPTNLAIVSWPSTFFIDALPSGTPFATQDGSLLTFKASISTGLKPFYVGDGMQRWSNVTRDSSPDFSIDASLVFQNYAYYVNYFKPNQKLFFGATFQGGLLGSISTTTYYEGWSWYFPAKIDTFKPDMSKNPVEGTLKLISEYDVGLGYAYKAAVTCQVPPVYTA